MRAPSRVQTARLVLSEARLEDAAAVFGRYASDPEVTRYLGWPRHRTVADTEAFLSFSAGQWERSGAGPYLVRTRTSDRLLGSTGLSVEESGRAMTGYVLAKDSWGQGYATEILRGVIGIASGIGIRKLYALCHPQHQASWHVLEKCGFERDAGWTEQAEFPNLAPGVLQAVLCYTKSLNRP